MWPAASALWISRWTEMVPRLSSAVAAVRMSAMARLRRPAAVAVVGVGMAVAPFASTGLVCDTRDAQEREKAPLPSQEGEGGEGVVVTTAGAA